MSIIHRPAHVGNFVAHDPEVCGLDPVTDCPSCRAAADARELAEMRRGQRTRIRAERRRTRPEARRLARLIRLHPRLIGRALVRGIAGELTELVGYYVGRALATRNGRAGA